jgi:hypothetical protein
MRLLIATLLFGMTTPLAAQDEGLMHQWEVVEMTKQLVEHTDTIKTILGQVRPKEWIQVGAPDAYVSQFEALRAELTNVNLSAEALGRKPETLSLAVHTFLWLDRVNSMLDSMADGVRRYQNPSVAELLIAGRNRNQGAELGLKDYMRQLADQWQTRMEIANDEAQRCRETLVKKPRAAQ